MTRLIALSLILCACNWKYEIVACKPRQCYPEGKYTIIFTDPKGQKYSMDNCTVYFPSKKSATAWARDFKLEPLAEFEDGSKRADCLKPIK